MFGKPKSIDFQQKKDEFEKIRKALLAAIPDGTDPPSETEKSIQDRLYKMIDYSIKRHDWYEDQKQKLLQIAVALLSVFAALSGIVAKLAFDKSIAGLTFWLICLFLLSGLIAGLYIVHKYNNTISLDHPYRKVTDIKSWFFKYNFGGQLADEISKNETKAKEEVDQIVNGFNRFTTNWLSFANEKKRFLVEDLEQVFILQILQKYRSEQLKSMSKALTCGLTVCSIFLTLSFVFYVISPNTSSKTEQQKLQSAIDSTRNSLLDSIAQSKVVLPDTTKVIKPNPSRINPMSKEIILDTSKKKEQH